MGTSASRVTEGDAVNLGPLADLGVVPGCRVGLCALGLEGEPAGKSFGVREDEAFRSASLIKLFVLAALLAEVEGGVASLEESLRVRAEDLVAYSPEVSTPGVFTVGGLAWAMITASDNTAANVLIRRLGVDAVNHLARSLGLRNTVLARKMMDVRAAGRGEENLTSPRDVVGLLSAVWRGDLLSGRHRRLFLEMLRRQRIEPPLPVRLPDGAMLAHKTGDLEGMAGDAGFVILPGHAYALCVIAEGDPGAAREPVRSATDVLARAFCLPLVRSGTRML